jgi:hypothetical protein
MAGLTSLCVTSPTMSCLGWSLVKARQALSLFFPSHKELNSREV